MRATKRKIEKIENDLEKLPKEAFKVFKEATPIRNGNARRNTRLSGTVINANYPYARRLDNGYSKQAPDGMINPTVEFVKQRVKEIFRGLR